MSWERDQVVHGVLQACPLLEHARERVPDGLVVEQFDHASDLVVESRQGATMEVLEGDSEDRPLVPVRGRAGGCGAVARKECDRESPAVVGQALASRDGDGEVRAVVGGPGRAAIPAWRRADPAEVDALRRELDEKDSRIEDLETENERKDARIDELEERLAALETQVGSAGLATADD